MQQEKNAQTPTRSNPAQNNSGPKNPSTVFYKVYGNGKVIVYDKSVEPPTSEGTEPGAEKFGPFALLASKFFHTGYDKDNDTSYTGTGYSYKTDKIKIFKRKGAQSSSKFFEGTVDSAEFAQIKEEYKLGVSMRLFALEIDTQNLVTIDIPPTSRGIFMDFTKEFGQFPDFSFSTRETSKADRDTIKKRAGGRAVNIPDYIPEFEYNTVMAVDYGPAESLLNEYLNGVRVPSNESDEAEAEQPETIVTYEQIDDLPF